VEAPIQTYETKRLASSTTLRRGRDRGSAAQTRVEEGTTDLVGSGGRADGQWKASRANGADSEAGGGRDAVRPAAGERGRAGRGGGDCRVTRGGPCVDGWMMMMGFSWWRRGGCWG